MSFADSYEEARIYLGWTFEFLAKRMGFKYSVEYLKRVHRGIPMPEVEQNLTNAYLRALAEKASMGRGIAKALELKFIDSFIEVVRKFDLSLKSAMVLSEETVKTDFTKRVDRELVEDRNQIDLSVWEQAIESIALDLIGGSADPKLFDIDFDNLFDSKGNCLTPSDKTDFVYQCPNCLQTYVNPVGSMCTNCGNRSLFNPIWD